MSQELDGGTLTLLILFGYRYWRICRSIGSQPRPDIEASTGGSRPDTPSSRKPAPLLESGEVATLLERLVDCGSEAAETLRAIRKIDRSFGSVHFLKGAVAAYEAVLTAFKDEDFATLAALTTEDVSRAFVAAAAERHKEDEWLEWTLLRIERVKIVGAALDRRSASIAVRFSSQFITSRRGRSGHPVGETQGTTVDTTDDWTFARELLSRDPNWKLVATAPA